jgi:DNA repair protein SbcD/Mre11
MRFLHTADWHMGKKLNGFALNEEQHDAFLQINQLAKDYAVDAVVIAGDLYDRSVPSEEAVAELNKDLIQLNLMEGLPILAVSGNHDSAVRLATGGAWFKATDFYMHTTVAQGIDEPVVLGDTQFFLLPFFGLQEVRNYFEDDTIKDLQVAMERIVAKMEENFKPGVAHVLVAHFFAAGASHTDSEIKVEVGGLNAVPTGLLAPFDYVALGHLHSKNALQEERVKYAGSPLKFSASEVNIEKGVWIVDTNPFNLQWVPLVPKHDLIKLTGSFDELANVETAANYDPGNFYVVELTDTVPIPDLMNRLRSYYPKVISLTRQRPDVSAEPMGVSSQAIENKSPLELLGDFYASATGGQKLSDDQLQWAKTTLQKARAKEEE